MKVLGHTDEVTTCDCCGRSNLKGTVALESADGLAIVHYGVVCAARATGKTARAIKRAADYADAMARQEAAKTWVVKAISQVTDAVVAEFRVTEAAARAYVDHYGLLHTTTAGVVVSLIGPALPVFTRTFMGQASHGEAVRVVARPIA